MDSRRVEAFRVLGIPADSDQDAVVHAYRKLARATHPDVSEDDDAADRFATVAAAYQLVSNEPQSMSIPVRIHEPEPGEEGASVRIEGGVTLGVPVHRTWVAPMSTILSGRRDRRAPIVAGPAWVDPYAVPSTRRCVVVDLGADRALFSISVAAEVTGVSPQMLRVYEQKGLLVPHRTEGGTRRYSGHELDRIGEITTLLAAGLNLAGVEHVFRLRAENLRLQDEVDRLHRRHASAEATEAGGPHSGR